MIINIEDVIDALESYRNVRDMSLEKMSKLLGLKGSSSYLRVKEMKSINLKYILTFFNNAEVSPVEFFATVTKMSESKSKVNQNETENTAEDTPPLYECTNPQCKEVIIERDRVIRMLARQVEDLYDRIDQLRTGKGASPPVKYHEGGVEKSKEAS